MAATPLIAFDVAGQALARWRLSGKFLLQPKSIEQPKKGLLYDVVAPGKGVRIFPPPPKGIDPYTATKTELARHGLPPRPDRQTQPAQAALWEHIANRYASFEHLQPNLSPLDTPTAPATTEADIAPFALYPFESCGYELFSPAATPFLVLAATWTVPNLKHKANPFGPNRFHTFLGLGFLDVHVNMTVDAAQNVTAAITTHNAQVALPVSPGDVMSAVLCSPGEPEGPNQSPSAYFLANETTSPNCQLPDRDRISRRPLESTRA